MDDLGERIEKLIKALGVTQKEFGERVGMRQTHVNLLKTGKRGLSLPNLEKIVNGTGASAHYLVTGNGPMFAESSREVQAFRLIEKIVYAVRSPSTAEEEWVSIADSVFGDKTEGPAGEDRRQGRSDRRKRGIGP